MGHNLLLSKFSLAGKIFVHSLAWITFYLVLVVFTDIYARLYSYTPLHFISTFCLLIPLFYLNYYYLIEKYLLNNKVLIYIVFILISLGIYSFLPILICEILPDSNFTKSYYDLHLALQSKMRLGTNILFVFVLLVGIVSILIELQQLKKNVEREKLKTDLALLKSQVNPHFLFNTLNSIYLMTLKKRDEAPTAVIALSDLMRYVLTETNAEFVPLKKEVDYVNKYIELQKLRLSNATNLNYTCEVANDTFLIAPLVLIPFIENAFKFGISTNTKSEISIHISADNEKLLMRVENTIIATSDEIDGTSVGLSNSQKRLELIYPEDHELIIKNENNVFLVELQINLLKE